MSNEFDPKLFDLDDSFSIVRAGRGSARSDDDYVLCGKGGYKNDGTNRDSLSLSLSKSTSELIRDLFGDDVTFATDKTGKGYIYIFKPTSNNKARKLSRNGRGGRCVISMSSMYDHYIDIQGKFRKLYLDVSFFDNGNALVFKPNGERDAE